MKTNRHLQFWTMAAILISALTLAAVFPGCSTGPNHALVAGKRTEPLDFFVAPPMPMGGLITGGLRNQSSFARSISAPVNADELWIISRNSDTSAQSTEDSPGSGSLLAKVEHKDLATQLQHT